MTRGLAGWSPGARALAAAVLTGVLFAFPRPARADDEGARAAFRQGIELYDAGKHEAALTAFERAYAQKPSGRIQQNIALCLKALGRDVEAARAFDRALAEGDSLAAQTRSAIDAQLAELTARVSTVLIRVVGLPEKTPLSDFVVTVDAAALPAGTLGTPLRVTPGVHTIEVKARGFQRSTQKKLALLKGPPVDVTFVLTPAEATVTVHAAVPEAELTVDGAPVGRGRWTGTLRSGRHKIAARAAGVESVERFVEVPEGGALDVPLPMRPRSGQPAPKETPRDPRRAYLVPMLMLTGGSYRFAAALDEPAGGSKRDVSGAGFGFRGGYKLIKFLSAELDGSVSFAGDTYPSPQGGPVNSTARATTWHLGPQMRFTSPGRVRFTGALGVGMGGMSLRAALSRSGQVVDKSGVQVGAVGLVDLGMQVEAGPIFFEGALALLIHGVGGIKDDAGERMLLSSPGVRSALRLGVGVPF